MENGPTTDWGTALDEMIDKTWERLRAVRRHFHRHPEPSGREFETTKYLAKQLSEFDIPHRLAPSQRGIIAESPLASAASRVIMRGDMDALNISDEKAVEYRSKHPGTMHACGHDAHTTMVLGAVLALNAVRGALPWPVPWRAIFQPAEETAQGAYEMIEAGALYDAAAIIALHVDPEQLIGEVSTRSGELTACCQSIEVKILGHGGHAARPHHSTDPIVAAVQYINAVYQGVPREVDSRSPSVVTFGVIQGGDNPNVIPESVTLRGTIRTMSRESAEQVGQILERIGRGVQEASGAAFAVHRSLGPDAVVNDSGVTSVVCAAASSVVGPTHVHTIPHASMGGEDFANYLKHIPGCMMRLGVRGEGQPKHFLHSPHFDIDERALAIGAKILARSLVMLANPDTRRLT